MSQNPQDTTNPGLVNVADQGDGLTVVDQPVSTGPSTNPGPIVQAGAEGFGLGDSDPDQPVTVGPSQNSAASIVDINFPGKIVEAGITNAGSFSPLSPDTINTTENTVVNQIYGQGNPQTVFV
jgi:hypothetical protein